MLKLHPFATQYVYNNSFSVLAKPFTALRCTSYVRRGLKSILQSTDFEIETKKSLRGPYFSPFVRGYSSELSKVGIDRDTFLAFIDGLNESYVAHPVFEGANILGAVVATFGVIHPVQWAGMGLSFTAVAASAGTSYTRTKGYLKTVNDNLFHPAGLHARILNTRTMMEAVGCDQDKLSLPALDTFEDADGASLSQSDTDSSSILSKANDPIMRRIKALEGYVLPLDFEVPPAVSPDGLLRKMGDSHARYLSRKQKEKLIKKREKAIESYHQKRDAAEKQQLQHEQEIARLERALSRERNSLEVMHNLQNGETGANMNEKAARKHEREIARLEKLIAEEKCKTVEGLEKTRDKADKAMMKADGKENKTAQKVRWIVLTNFHDEEDDEELSE